MQQFYLKKAGLNNNTAVTDTATAGDEPSSEYKIEDDFVKKIREAIEKNLTDTRVCFNATGMADE